MASIIKFPNANPDYKLFEPPVVLAPNPDGSGDFITLEISASTLAKIVQSHRHTQMFEAWAHLVGEFPPVNNAFKAQLENAGKELRSLRESAVCFKGVRRPVDSDDSGADVHVYSFSTPFTVRWKPDMACVAAVMPAPEGTVMTVLVRPAASLQPVNPEVWGVITKWEFVGACPEHPDLPRDYTERYDEQLLPAKP